MPVQPLLYACLRGYNHTKNRLEPPVSAPARINEGIELPHIQNITTQGIQPHVAETIMRGLELKPKDRPQTVEEFQASLFSPSLFSEEKSESNEKQIELLIVAGEFEGEKIPLSSKPIVIGKDQRRCNLIFADSMISRMHCQIQIQNNHIYVRDLNSTNGTWINDQRIQHETQVRVGDIISLAGRTVFQIIQVPKQQPARVAEKQEEDQGSSLRLAGFGERLAAFCIDLSIIFVFVGPDNGHLE